MCEGIYSLAQVREAERVAWTCSAHADRPDFHFDGIFFWRVTPRGEHVAVPEEQELPDTGWWHKADCNCRLCRERSETRAGDSAGSGKTDALSHATDGRRRAGSQVKA
jgi:hypothetical protein